MHALLKRSLCSRHERAFDRRLKVLVEGVAKRDLDVSPRS